MHRLALTVTMPAISTETRLGSLGAEPRFLDCPLAQLLRKIAPFSA